MEEAICYGWIDSIVKKMDEERYCQRFTPRNFKSIWSDTNIMRLKKMLDAGKMEQPGLDKIPPDIMEMAKSGTILHSDPAIPKVLKTPKDLENALNENPEALDNWKRFAPSHRKMYIYWIMDAKKPETRTRRIARVVGYAKENRKSMM